MIKVGVLAFQGSVEEHIEHLGMLPGVSPLPVKNATDLKKVEGLILPGGESTTLGKLLREYGLIDPIKEAAQKGMPIWGTCAGMILMAKKIAGESTTHLGIMDITVRRNAYGRQIDSFAETAVIPEISEKKIPLIFIRAPIIEEAGPEVKILLTLSDKIVAAQQQNLLATSFHPELTGDLSFHRYFVEMIKKRKNF